VLTFIPARDQQEFDLLPQTDRDFIHGWLQFTDEKLEYIRNTMPIATLGGPGIGNVDGTSAMHAEEGFLFLFNPNPQPFNAPLVVDESIGLSNSSASSSWKVTELYPSKGTVVGVWKHGQEIALPVGGSDARVLQLEKQSVEEPTTVTLIGAPGVGMVHGGLQEGAQSTLELTDVQGLEASTAKVHAVLPSGHAGAAVKINGVTCAGTANGTEVELEVSFEGTSPVYHSMPISEDAVVTSDWKGGWLNVSFNVPAAIKKQVDSLSTRAY
jgi:hypothetical protein